MGRRDEADARTIIPHPAASCGLSPLKIKTLFLLMSGTRGGTQMRESFVNERDGTRVAQTGDRRGCWEKWSSAHEKWSLSGNDQKKKNMHY